MRDFSMLIDGRAAAGAATMNVISPATEELIATCPCVEFSKESVPGYTDIQVISIAAS